MKIALICIALLGVLVFALGFNVSRIRGKTETVSGSSNAPDDALNKAIRAHGNTVEFAPMMALLIYILGSMNPELWVVWCMGLATLSRYSLAVGLLVSKTMDKPHPLRFVGALGTYLFGLALCVALILELL